MYAKIINDFDVLSPALKNDPRVLKRKGSQKGATSLAPRNYLKTIKQYMKENLSDPRSVIDFTATKPVFSRCTDERGREVFGWVVEVKYNAKNQLGGYVGLSKTRHLFQGEKFHSKYPTVLSYWKCYSQR